MHVEIYVLRRGKDKLAGRISLEEGRLVPKGPETDMPENLLDEPVHDMKTKEAVYSDKDPEAFLRNLQYTYRSPYLRAGAVEE